KEIPFLELEEKIANTRSSYFRYGISFDNSFKLAFMEQEINGNSLIRKQPNGQLLLDERNINHYLKLRDDRITHFFRSQYLNKNVFLFKTLGYFYDQSEARVHSLYNGHLTIGICKVSNIKEEVKALNTKSTYYLVYNIKYTGQFEYGYFSAF